MIRGTFANIRLRSQLAPSTEGGWTRDFARPEPLVVTIHDAAVHYATARARRVPRGGRRARAASDRSTPARVGTALLDQVRHPPVRASFRGEGPEARPVAQPEWRGRPCSRAKARPTHRQVPFEQGVYHRPRPQATNPKPRPKPGRRRSTLRSDPGPWPGRAPRRGASAEQESRIRAGVSSETSRSPRSPLRRTPRPTRRTTPSATDTEGRWPW